MLRCDFGVKSTNSFLLNKKFGGFIQKKTSEFTSGGCSELFGSAHDYQ
jgi:hypothetical protein